MWHGAEKLWMPNIQVKSYRIPFRSLPVNQIKHEEAAEVQIAGLLPSFSQGTQRWWLENRDEQSSAN